MYARLEVAVIIDPGSPYDRRIVRGVAAYAEHNAREWSLYVEEEHFSRMPDLKAWAGDGIVANFDDRRVAAAVAGLGIPVVAVGGGYGYYDRRSKIPYVHTDNRAIAQLAAEHLISLGLQRFAFCSQPLTRTNGWAKERADAFQEFITAAGFPCDVFTGRYSPVRNWRRAQAGLQQWLKTLPRPIGMMACDDSRARHVLQACRMNGLRVPEDIALIGVDNDDVICELTHPRLTSIEQGAVGVGYEAASVLDKMIGGTRPKQLSAVVPPVALIARKSTDVTAVADPNVAEALQYIRQHGCGPIKVHHVLKVVKMSRTNLECKFNDTVGRSVHAEIVRVRVEAAKRLLTTTSVPIKEVSRRVGVSSVQYFTVMMRNATGQTPGQLRKAILR
jgi:LacI family transcriptional regulator